MSLLEAAQQKLDDMASNPRGISRASNTSNVWNPLKPLPEVTAASATDFPFDGLGPLLGPAAKSIADDVQAPDALAGGSVLACAALAVQPHANVAMPHGQQSPLSLFVLSSGESGDRKSATDRVAGEPIESYRREQARQHAADLQEFERDRASRPKGEGEAERPLAKSLTIGKATVEGLMAMLKGQSHIGLFTAEGGELLGGHSMREERRTAGLAWFLKAWGGEALDTLTKGDGLCVLVERRVSIHALVQPILLRSLLSDPLAQGQGFLSRCLIAEPRTLAGSRLFKACDPSQSPAVQRYHAAIQRMLSRPAPTVPGDFELQPRRLGMSPEASALWIEFYNEIEVRQADGAELHGARAFSSKTAEHAARIAGVVEMIGNPSAHEIGIDAMAGAIEVATFYLNEHLRLTGVSAEHRRLTQLHALWNWMQERGSRVSRDDVLQRSPNQLRKLKASGLNDLLNELAERNYIRAAGSGWEVRP